MQNKFKEFWIDIEINKPNIKVTNVWTSHCLEAVHVIEYAALESANAEIEKLKNFKPHFTGATYAMTQDNFNRLIVQLEAANAEIASIRAKYRAELENDLKIASELKSENTKLADEKESIRTQLLAQCKISNELLDENAKLRAALEFYADISNHEEANEALRPINLDNGKIAREALEKSK